MKRMDKQQAMILILGAILLVGFGVFRYIPIVHKKITLKEQMSRQSLSMEQIQEYSRMLPELHQKKKALEANLQYASAKIPQGKQFAQLWQQIAEAMNVCKLEDQVVQPGAEIKSQEVCCIPLKIECKGKLEQMFMFFRRLENFDRLIRFEEIQLENSEDFNAVIKLNARANIYYRPSRSDNG